MRDIRLALLEADVEFSVVKDLIETVKTQVAARRGSAALGVAGAAGRQDLP